MADAVENRLHADVREYLKEAQSIVDANPDLEQATRELRALRMPFLVGSLSVHPEGRQVYALLPTGDTALTLPRGRLVPVIRELLAGLCRQSERGGGILDLHQAWRWDLGIHHSAELGGGDVTHPHFGEQRGGTIPGFGRWPATVEQQLIAPRDMDSTVFDEVIARNPTWRFIPQPQPRTQAKAGKPIPPRSSEATSKMVDLTPFYHAALDESWHQGGLPNNTLEALPPGLHEFDGTEFDVRGIVQLAGAQADRELSVQFPVEVNGIEVEQETARVRFLHACGWCTPLRHSGGNLCGALRQRRVTGGTDSSTTATFRIGG